MKNTTNIIAKAVTMIAIILIMMKPASAYATCYNYDGVERHENEDTALKASVDRCFSDFPLSVKRRFLDFGWDYALIEVGELDDARGKKMMPGWYCDGLTDYDNKMIFVEARPGNNNTFYHEMGHYIDFTYKGDYGDCDGLDASASFEFIQIYREEKDAFGEYGATRIEEFFAEAVCFYMSDPDACKEKAPRAYEYVSRILEAY